MQVSESLGFTRGLGALLLLTVSAHTTPAQRADSARSSRVIGGGVTVTNNGISLLPTFTLGKPAAIFDLTLGGRALRFEPQFRFALEGKPWAFIFWWRYRLLRAGRFSVNVGAHPAVLFKTAPSPTEADSAQTIVAQRYVAGELSPRYALGNGVSVGTYYLYSHGFDPGGTSNTHFVTANATFANLRLTERLHLTVSPQVYYLSMDEQDGYYTTATVSLHIRDFPLSVQSIMNHAITTTIVAEDDFVWNVSLIYSFKREYERKS